MLFFKTMFYLSLIVPNIIDISSNESSCYCISLAKSSMDPSSVFCEPYGFGDLCNDFIFELNECYNCLHEWSDNSLLFSIGRIYISTMFLVNGSYLVSIFVLLTRNYRIRDVINFVEKKIF